MKNKVQALDIDLNIKIPSIILFSTNLKKKFSHTAWTLEITLIPFNRASSRKKILSWAPKNLWKFWRNKMKIWIVGWEIFNRNNWRMLNTYSLGIRNIISLRRWSINCSRVEVLQKRKKKTEKFGMRWLSTQRLETKRLKQWRTW